MSKATDYWAAIQSDNFPAAFARSRASGTFPERTEDTSRNVPRLAVGDS